MHYRLLFRPPLLWVTIAECLLLAAAVVLAWHIWQGRHPSVASPSQSAAAAPVSQLPASRSPALPSTSPSPAPAGSAPQAGPTPGTRTDAAFLSRQMTELNRVEATFEDLEWRMTKALADAIQNYVERVVLPPIERSERSHP